VCSADVERAAILQSFVSIQVNLFVGSLLPANCSLDVGVHPGLVWCLCMHAYLHAKTFWKRLKGTRAQSRRTMLWSLLPIDGNEVGHGSYVTTHNQVKCNVLASGESTSWFC